MHRLIALAALATSGPLLAAGPGGQPVFQWDRDRPVVRLDRVPQSEGMKAILALYALESSAGCEGNDEQGRVKCALTRELGLGANCSEAHIGLVRDWFTRIPKLTSRWIEQRDGDAKKPGALEDFCYRQPDTAGWQNVWEFIRVEVNADRVTVDATWFGGSGYGRTRERSIARYRIGAHEITPLGARTIVLERSSKGIHEGK